MTEAITREFLSFATELADEGRAIIETSFGSAPNVDLKADASFVTTTDRAVEKHLRERIEAAYPSHGVLGEEYGRTNIDSEFVWVIDPIDGTAAFVAGIPVYGILIAVAQAGKPWLGVMDFPATSERLKGVSGQWARYYGRGASHEGLPIQCRPCDNLATAYLTSSNPRFLSLQEKTAFERLDQQVAFTQYGGSCYAYGCLARGRTDLAVDGSFDAYDLFACAAIIEGAGGMVTDWQGQRLDLTWHGGVLASGDGRMHRQALELLAGTSG